MKEQVVQNDLPPHRQLRRYGDKSTQQKSAFWLHPDRWTREIALEILAPLKAAVYRDGVLANAIWRQYLQTLYDVACQATYEYRIRQGPNGEESLNDVQSVYAAIRAVPEEKFPNRPPISEVPTTDGGPWDLGRRDQFFLTSADIEVQETRDL